MNEVDVLRQLDRAAQSSAAPPRPMGDVTGWVLDDIRRAQSQFDERRVWQIAAGLGCVAATLAVFAVLQVYVSFENPLADIGLQAFVSIESPFASPLHVE